MSIYRYYVYAYIRSKDSSTAKAGTPYYIGKGQNDRAWMKHKNVPTPKDTSKIIILETNLSELGAFAIERRLIEWWGRKIVGNGILLNKSAGGEGSTGAVMSEEAKKNMSKAQKGRVVSEKTKQKLSEAKTGRAGTKHTKEWLEEHIKRNTGSKRSDTTKLLMSKLNSGENNPRYGVSPTEEQLQKQKKSCLAQRQIKYACQHCGKEVDKQNLSRYHNDRCKLLTTSNNKQSLI